MDDKVVLAYSGGLDTSAILHWLIDKGHEVVCFCADVGQEDDLDAAAAKAEEIGASEVYVEDLREEFVEEYIFPALQAHAVYEEQYLLGTALARPLTAKKQVEIAHEIGTNAVAHGATGKGNDQVRFETVYYSLMDDPQIISPWKDEEFLEQFQGRSDLLEYCEEHDIPVEASSDAPYSMDPNLMHTSYEAGELEDPKTTPAQDMFEKTVAPDDAPDTLTELSITFENGIPETVQDHTNGVVKKSPVELFTYLNEVGGENGIGRVDMVENRYVGLKNRGVYETPGQTILLQAHKDLEGIALDKEVKHLKQQLAPVIAKKTYNGLWFSPEMQCLKAFVQESQEGLDGTVHLELYKGNITVTAREAKGSLYDEDLVSMDKHGGYDQQDAEEFIKLHALRLTLGGDNAHS